MEELIASFRNSRLQFAPSVTWATNGSGDVLLYSDCLLRLESCSRNLIRCMQLLEKGAHYQELSEVSDDQGSLDSTLEILIRARYLVHARPNEWKLTPVEKQVDYFSAHGIDGNAAQRKLGQAHVVILGVGGTGTVVLQHLVAGGLRNFSLIDPDRVQLGNLNRQLIFSPNQVGMFKVTAARDYIVKNNDRAKILTFHKRIETLEDLMQLALPETVHLLVLAADRPVGVIQKTTAEFCLRRSIPFVEGSCGFQTAVCGPLIGPGSYQKYLAELSADMGSVNGYRLDSGARPKTVMEASFGPTNTILGAFMARDIVHYLVGIPAASLDSLIVMNFESATTERVPFFRNADN